MTTDVRVQGSLHPNKVVTSKYTVLTFFPMNIFHQLSKGSTFFFFITLVLLCIPSISPFEPWTYLIAFSIVVGVSMIKDAMEDYKRHKDDRKINETTVHVVKRTGWRLVVEKKWCMDLQKGDWLFAENNKEIQADVVLVRSCLPGRNKTKCGSHCFVETSNIDGESNLKKRNAIPIPRNLRVGSEMCNSEDGSICRCVEQYMDGIEMFDLKNTGDSFSEFECDIGFRGTLLIANEKNVLLRGSILRNTEHALCLVVGVGEETKQSKSICRIKKGKTLFDSRMNFILVLALVLYGLMMGITALVGAMFLMKNRDFEYLGVGSLGSSVAKIVFSNYVLYIYLIPLSLYVMLELARFVHAFYIKHDLEMRTNSTESVCRNSNVIEDLGVIDYVLTDKTGTITKNSMTLKYIHSGDNVSLSRPYDFCSGVAKAASEGKLEEILETDSDAEKGLLFVINMLVCNSVEILNGRAEGISQEELCFLDAIKQHGFELKDRGDNHVTVDICGRSLRISIVATLEFSSRRQRMSVIAKMFGRMYLFTKGSDQKLLDREKDRTVLRIINSSTDYRSLVLKFRRLVDRDVEEFLQTATIRIDTDDESLYDGNLLQRRREKEEECFGRLEADTVYLGSAFIEDELQDEIQDTMRALKEAGMKIWMITGDKKETAVACGRNASIIENNEYICLSGKDALLQIETDEEGSGMFGTRSVIIYRATPSQKGNIALSLVKSKRNVLSIGDGNNDVAMLKTSHVGVGIMGKEGTQAALSADFAIPEFRFLRNLLFLHGRYSLVRYTKTALNSYYKNILFILVQFLYNMYSGASARPLYNSFFLNYYNLFFTSMIPFTISMFDRDIPPAQAINQPASYRNARLYFRNPFVFLNVALACVEAIGIFFVIKLMTAEDIAGPSGRLGGFSCISTLFSVVVVYTVVLRQIRYISFKVVYNDVAIAVSVILNVLAVFGIQEISNRNNLTMYHLLQMPAFYFVSFGIGSLVYVVDTVYESIELHMLDKMKYKE